MPFRFIKVNKAKCRHCSDVLVSNTEKRKLAAEEHTCSCGKLTISGGGTALVRTGRQGIDYDEMSIMNFDDCPAVLEGVQDPPPEQGKLIDHITNTKRK